MSRAGDIEYQAQKNTTINHYIRIRWGVTWQGRDVLIFYGRDHGPYNLTIWIKKTWTFVSDLDLPMSFWNNRNIYTIQHNNQMVQDHVWDGGRTYRDRFYPVSWVKIQNKNMTTHWWSFTMDTVTKWKTKTWQSAGYIECVWGLGPCSILFYGS